jgi:hypothetical protein
MEMIRWKRLLIDTGRGQLRRLSVQLNANEIRHATGSRISWKATASEPRPIVPAADLCRAIALSRTDHQDLNIRRYLKECRRSHVLRRADLRPRKSGFPGIESETCKYAR